MRLPAFFERVPRIRLHDPLADVLGSAEGGVLEYGYGDAVRVAGHSCPTVASAYWLTWRALDALYPHTLPERGAIKVEMRDDANGVIASVVQMLTGAAGNSGFKGIGGRYARAGLLRVTPDLPLAMRYTRLDTGAAVDASVDLSLVPEDPALPGLVERCTRGRADGESLARLAQLWQARVRALLIDFAHDDGVFVVRPLGRPPHAAAGSPLALH
jgi:hypothetical protein